MCVCVCVYIYYMYIYLYVCTPIHRHPPLFCSNLLQVVGLRELSDRVLTYFVGQLPGTGSARSDGGPGKAYCGLGTRRGVDRPVHRSWTGPTDWCFTFTGFWVKVCQYIYCPPPYGVTFFCFFFNFYFIFNFFIFNFFIFISVFTDIDAINQKLVAHSLGCRFNP